MIKIIITGPESCGKTTLARQLAAHFDVSLVEEYVRAFFEKKETPQYNAADLLKIAMGQRAAENQAETALSKPFRSKKPTDSPKLIVCDTDLLTIKIWSEEKYGRCDERIIRGVSDAKFSISDGQSVALSSNLRPPTSKLQLPTIYFLCSPEGIAWEADPLRENATDRDRLFTIYEKNLIEYQKTYVILRGGIEARFDEARRLIERQLMLF